MNTDLELARAVKRALHPRETVQLLGRRASTGPTRLAALLRDRPDVRVRLGTAALTAAAHRSVPRGRCHWCVAALVASVRNVNPPRFDAASRELLGDPCDKCMTRMRDEVARRVQRRQRLDAIRASAAAHVEDERRAREGDRLRYLEAEVATLRAQVTQTSSATGRTSTRSNQPRATRKPVRTRSRTANTGAFSLARRDAHIDAEWRRYVAKKKGNRR